AANFYQPAVTVLDATSNWWNLTVASQVAATIYDQSDSPGSPHVNFGQYLDAQNGSPVVANSLIGPVSGTLDTLSGGVYEVLGDIQVAAGNQLTIDAGVSLLFIDNATLTVDGSFTVQGTALEPVSFSSATASAGAWQGIQVNPTATSVSIDQAIIEYATYGIYFNESAAVGTVSNTVLSSNSRGIYLRGNASPVIGGGNRIDNNQYGLYLEGLGTTGNSPLPTINGNEIYANSSYDVYTVSYFAGDNPVVDAVSNYWGSTDLNTIANRIYDIADSAFNRPVVNFSGFLDMPGGQADGRQFLLTGNITQNTTIAADTRYIVPYSVDIAAGSTLTVEQGVELYFLKNKGITVNGALNINGVATNEVILTSATRFLAANTYDWSGIRVEGAAGTVSIQYANISHAANGIYFNNASGTVSNSIFTENLYGIYLNGSSSPLIDANTFVDNSYALYLNGVTTDPLPTITNNDFYSNNTNLYLYAIDTTTVLNIGNNWWGTSVVADIRNTIISGGGSDQLLSVLLDAISTTPLQLAVPTGLVASEQYISPAQSVGIQDSVDISASFSLSSNWSVAVKNSSGQTVRTYTGTGTALSVNWDGKDATAQNVADGVYVFAISVAGTEVRHLRSVIVDNALPTATFVAGLDGTTVNEGTLAINGSATDNYFASYLVEYGQGPTPASWTGIGGLNATPVTAGKLVDWQITNTSGLTPPPNGDNAIRLTVTDLAGNSSTQQVQVTLNTLAIYNVSHDVTTINPAAGEASLISFTLNNPATVTLQIAAEKDGTLLRTISQNYTGAGTFSLGWDGKDDTASYAPDEAYVYTLLADDGSRQASYAPAFTPAVGSISGGSVGLGYSVSKNKFWKNATTVSSTNGGRVRLCIGSTTSFPSAACTGATHFAAIDDVPYENGSHWLYWDGRDPNGNAIRSKVYRFFLSVPSTLPPNTIIIKGAAPFVHGEAAVAPNIEVKSNPYKVRHSYDESSRVKYQVDQDSNVTVKLLPPGINDPADPSAIVLINNALQTAEASPGVPNVYSFEWLGYDNSVATPDTNNIQVSQNGRYTFTIQATSVVTGFTTLYRGSLRLYH
ncbi:MAG TPA: hypothetical protein ENJ64_05300, partial [Thiotrichales bacterium]|nr:hypothetical protein [Thiotrichales bacterium]